jgi:hypothetical protein
LRHVRRTVGIDDAGIDHTVWSRRVPFARDHGEDDTEGTHPSAVWPDPYRLITAQEADALAIASAFGRRASTVTLRLLPHARSDDAQLADVAVDVVTPDTAIDAGRGPVTISVTRFSDHMPLVPSSALPATTIVELSRRA